MCHRWKQGFCTLEVFPGTTIREVKQMITAEKHIDRFCQHIFFEGQELEDECETIEGCSIGREGTVQVTEILEEEEDAIFDIVVKTPNKKQITLYNIASSDTVLTIKWKLHDELGGALAVEHMRLTCKELRNPDQWAELFNDCELSFYEIRDLELYLEKAVPGVGLQTTHWHYDPEFWRDWEDWDAWETWDAWWGEWGPDNE